ncbi:MAG: PAS domain S-box protein [Thermodesulfobacteriota bacterium]
MKNIFNLIRQRLVAKLILTVGLVFLLSVSTWAYFNVRYQKQKVMQNIVSATDRLTTTIRLGTHYAMMLNSRDDINQIITNIGKLPEIKNIRIYNKSGEIKFSNSMSEVDLATNIKAEACDICHRSDPPYSELDLSQRTRIFNDPAGYRLLGIISPIRNEPGCAGECHVHPEGKKILGALDLVVSLQQTDQEISNAQRGIVSMTVVVFLLTATIIFLFVLFFVNRPISKLIRRTRLIARGDYRQQVPIRQNDEIGLLGNAIDKMGHDITEKQTALNKQRDEYMDLFQRVPCLITVQDRSYNLLRYNREFGEKFGPRPGEHCYEAYKGRSQKCVSCPVEKTFADGKSYSTEETGMDKDGSIKHWIVRSSPIFDENGELVAAMEISLDITERKLLEVELEQSEKKYHAIFNNIPNPVFVLDNNTLEILDSNNSVAAVYGYTGGEVKGRSFMDFFKNDESVLYAPKLKTVSVINQAKHIAKDGKELYVNIRVSPSEYSNQKVLLVTTSDITKRLETEQQLIQASKMATLGEMATGVAHELNQPLSVIKTASSFLVKKIGNRQPVQEDILETMLEKVDHNVDRATKIINHMRQFARKSGMEMGTIDIHAVLESAFEIFSQQLKARGIEIKREFSRNLPKINADPDRLEQVFINLLLNARDAIEERHAGHPSGLDLEKRISLKTSHDGHSVIIDVCDTGVGISPHIQEKIFEPFFTTKEVGKGTGLGLSISYGIIKDCGGEIVAVPSREQGTCFRITFPALKPSPQNT